MPSFQEHLVTLASWRELSGREWLGRDGAVALTFDDGPDPDATPVVLDALDAVGAKATFFVVVDQLVDHSDLGSELVARGHEIAVHGLTHAPHEELRDGEVERATEEVRRLTGVSPRLYRPAYGRFTAESHRECLAVGLEPVYWSAWGEDWEPLAPERIADLVCRDLRPRSIVLLHDSPRYGHRPSALPTAQAVPLIAERARTLGLGLEPVTPSANL